MTCTLYEAGHILGSAIVILKVRENGREVKIGFTGDLGRFNKPIIKDPALNFAEEDRELDLLILESTYGDRTHEPVADLKPKLQKVLRETFERQGSLVIPSFAYGRTQELLYVIHEIYDAGEAVRVPVFVDSPLATNLTRVFGEHPESYDRETHKTFLERGENPFFFEQVHFTESVEESMQLMRDETPHIVISASGMCEAGRILHHLRHKIHNPKNTIMIVGFMARHTLGRRIQELGAAYEASGRSGEPPLVRFYNKEYPLRARVVQMDGFSAHADRSEMLRFLTESNLNVRRIALVHGEEEQSLAFRDFLDQRGFNVTVPRAGETVRV
jgi:metallo-beta-lactamase family protein